MKDLFKIDSQTQKLPTAIVAIVVGICVLPFIMQMFGVDFGSETKLTGAFTHTILEWSAVCIAICTAILSLMHYNVTKNITVPIMGMALFFSGCMDAFHTLAAARLIGSVTDTSDFVPFTWALARMFNAIIVLGGAYLVTKTQQITDKSKLITGMVVGLTTLAYGLVYFSYTADSLPQTMYPGSLVTRPFDALPLFFYAVGIIWVYPKLHKGFPSLFSSAILVSMIPEVFTELHMAFGSERLFDDNFNVAHFLKIIAYLVPFTGLMLDYIYTYHLQIDSNVKLEELHKAQKLIEEELIIRAEKLAESNADLERFAYVASHDLQEPLRMISGYTQLLAKENPKNLTPDSYTYIEYAISGANRLKHMIDGLLEYSRIGTESEQFETVKIHQPLEDALKNLSVLVEENNAVIEFEYLPEIYGNRQQLMHLFQNFISNSIKFKSEEDPYISISVGERDDDYLFSVSDNGIGIDPKYADSIFEVFKRLHSRFHYEGTGIGLSICKKIINRHGGEIWIESEEGKGTTFHFTMPKEL